MEYLWPLVVLKAWLFVEVKLYSLEVLVDLRFALLARRLVEQVSALVGAVNYRLPVLLTVYRR